jgi:hypothetical protein
MPLPKKSILKKPVSNVKFTGKFTNKEKTKVIWDFKKAKIKDNTAK